MDFLKKIPHPAFNKILKRRLIALCEALEPFECIKGTVIFNQDDPIEYIYIVEGNEDPKMGESLFSSQVRLSTSKKQQGLDPSEMLKESDETSGKLASMSKNMSTKAGGKKTRMHEIARLGRGSVIGVEDYIVAKSDVHVTSLVCISHVGKLYRIKRDFFF